MANPRRGRAAAGSSGGSARTTRRRSGRVPSASPVPIVLGVSACVLIVLLIFVMSQGGDDAGAQASDGSRSSTGSAPAAAASPPSRSGAVLESNGEGRPGKTPDRPAPPIVASDLELAERHYQLAKDKWNEGQVARRAGDTKAYTQAVTLAWDEIQKQRDAIRDYTDWYMEADFEDWAIPAAYDDLAGRLERFDRLFQMIKKMKVVR